uniref:polyprenyl synthetase family protein n=1 Tax=Okeania sp. SIO2F4 TaxID=2607790 RepID=UPI0025D60523
GVTYPLVDNIFDSKHIISNTQKKVFAKILTDAISGINVSPKVTNIPFLRELYRCCLELKYILNNQSNNNSLSYIKIFHLAQVGDNGDNQEKLNSAGNVDFLFTRIILKSSFARIATASLAGYPINDEFIHKSILMGINNQLSNDFEGFIQDVANDAATPYTLFLQKKIEINPLIFTFDYYIFSSNFQLDKKVYIQACLLRFVETIREFVKNYGFSKYQKFIDDLTDNNILYTNRNLFYQLGEISKYSIHLHQETWISEYLDSCAEKYVLQYKDNNYSFDIWKFNAEARPWIEKVIVNENEQLDELEKYALSGFCHRNRPLLCLLMGKIYGLDFEHLTGLVRAIEYFHSASLILDDLPTQDNASLRRGKLAFHKKYSQAEAQITAVSLIAKGYDELENILTDDTSKIKIIQYASKICSNNGLCLGQIKDLKCRDSQEVSLDDLKEIAYLKTGLAIEFCLVSVSILAKDSAENIEKLKLFSKYIGIAYQIKDDLKDSLSISETGKDQFLDRTNKKSSSFLYLLEPVKAKELLDDYKNFAIDTLLKIDLDLSTLQEFIELFFAFTDIEVID